jgi:hypothetical protein
MMAPPKDKSSARPTAETDEQARSEGADRTSAIVTTTLIGLALLGTGTVFWEPLTALAFGAPAAESMGDSHPFGATSPTTNDAGAASPNAPDASGNS